MPEHKPLILVVDDNRTNVNMVIQGLQSNFDYDFLTAYDGAEGLSKINRHKPDIIVMDVEMPKMGGYDVCRIIKSSNKFDFMPVILMTAREDMESKIAGLELGADDYLIKPVNMLELAAKLKSMLRLKFLQDQLKERNNQLESLNEKLQQMSITDSLTGIYNRRYFYQRLSVEFARAQRYQLPLTCIMMDLDHFKSINDNYGHPFGDLVLQGTSVILKDSVRKIDLLARYGGEEMIMVLPETTVEGGFTVAERIRKSLSEKEFSDDNSIVHVTASFGTSTFPYQGVDSYEEMIKLADKALYNAKESGRNQVRQYENIIPKNSK